ncbi:anhydro-N-acetylmuramic acid kinase [Agromyces sp. SYSU K20354]|uniref:anhydro-N-acetylmuramic acid kinase n=1 Tax=Agromyces cavernae TaxID=2898659 RepID=UPI001E36BDD4|nr:anhydro-N-acetylmuramic acid kinase [Agromyces cavernae]MCD2441490.1 anhydro-N-acetylmuramic acid kinase [Agromyces cavernae]
MIVLSLQSGTSADGIDVAVVEIVPVGRVASASERIETRNAQGLDTRPPSSGARSRYGAGAPPRPTAISLTVHHTETVDWEPDLRAQILAVAAGEALDAGAWTRLTTRLGQSFAEAAARGIRESGVTPDLIVSHGQTVYHWVESGHARGTLQLGEPAWIAERTGVPVLSDVRMADIAAGGEGAPLMAAFDRAWLGADARAEGRSIATVNLGGIANVQLVGTDGEVVAFDSGPGNCLIDAVVDRHSRGVDGFDDGGRLAAAGRVHDGLLAQLLRHPYFAAPTPKSTGRETFDLGLVDAAIVASGAFGLGVHDLVATLTELTARSVIEAITTERADQPAALVCSGGGTLNPVLLARLTTLGVERGIAVESSADRGIDPAFKESLLFAFLGYCSWHGVPFPLGRDTSGRVLGRLSPAAGPLRLPEPLAEGTSVAIERVGHIERVERAELDELDERIERVELDERIESGGGAR